MVFMEVFPCVGLMMKLQDYYHGTCILGFDITMALICVCGVG